MCFRSNDPAVFVHRARRAWSLEAPLGGSRGNPGTNKPTNTWNGNKQLDECIGVQAVWDIVAAEPNLRFWSALVNKQAEFARHKTSFYF